jgi:signal transduction histidine kinase
MLPAEVERMKLIIDGLSDYSKAHPLRIEPVEMTEIIEKVLAILSYEIKRNNVFIKKNYPPEGEEKAVALADKYRIVQVFMNIIANAVQAIGKQGGDLSLTVRRDEKEIRISIMDTGPGIPHEQLQKIFDPFFTTKEAGTGLGLSITKKIIDEHNGSVYVDSHVGEGTTFTVCLPRA